MTHSAQQRPPLSFSVRGLKSGAASFAIPAVTVFVLAVVQYLFTDAALCRMHYEELAESVRNPYWLSQHTMYNQWSSNVGWYGALCATYSVIGFDVYTAKWVRFALHVLSLSCLAAVFIRWQGVVRGSGLLAVVGLSSTWLYFNTYQTSYGIDLQFVPLLMCILFVTRRDQRSWEARAFWFGLLVCVAALCYPTSLFYLPGCVLIIAYGLWSADQIPRVGTVGWSLACFAVGFYLPIGAALAYLKAPGILADGLFRGGGAGMQLDLQVILDGVSRVTLDLFVQAGSYGFDLPHVEFAGWMPFVLFCITLGGATLYLLTAFATRRPINGSCAGLSISLFFLIWFLVIPNLVPNSPGIRRSTGVLVGYYAAFSFLLAVLWNAEFPFASRRVQPSLAWTLLVLNVLTNGLTMARNVVAYPEMASDVNEAWVMVQGDPRDSLEHWFHHCQEGQSLKCEKFGPDCRYAIRFAAVRAQQQWNGRGEFPIYGVDPRDGEVTLLELSLWEQLRWPH